MAFKPLDKGIHHVINRRDISEPMEVGLVARMEFLTIKLWLCMNPRCTTTKRSALCHSRLSIRPAHLGLSGLKFSVRGAARSLKTPFH